ncbi:MAG: PilX N-terminal domain-containing pilus assembly protein [Xanthomonadales bacterium]|nr:PilX N-terminal domain-containing pilus assembly protein [Xanthomonadales bacterium]
MKNTHIYNKHKQHGVALIASMVLLLVITLLSLSSMRNTNIDTKIAVNHQHKQISFQAAESALFKLMSPNPTVTVPLTEAAVPIMNSDYFKSNKSASRPGVEADLSMDYIRASNPGEFKFNGFGLSLTTLIYQADAIGSVAGSKATAHNRMGVVLIRN